jgi:hypothetical protein
VFAMAVVAGGDAINVLAHRGFTGVAPIMHFTSFIGLLLLGGWVWQTRPACE